jgi:hypothetical protein
MRGKALGSVNIGCSHRIATALLDTLNKIRKITQL